MIPDLYLVISHVVVVVFCFFFVVVVAFALLHLLFDVGDGEGDDDNSADAVKLWFLLSWSWCCVDNVIDVSVMLLKMVKRVLRW